MRLSEHLGVGRLLHLGPCLVFISYCLWLTPSLAAENSSIPYIAKFENQSFQGTYQGSLVQGKPDGYGVFSYSYNSRTSGIRNVRWEGLWTDGLLNGPVVETDTSANAAGGDVYVKRGIAKYGYGSGKWIWKANDKIMNLIEYKNTRTNGVSDACETDYFDGRPLSTRCFQGDQLVSTVDHHWQETENAYNSPDSSAGQFAKAFATAWLEVEQAKNAQRSMEKASQARTSYSQGSYSYSNSSNYDEKHYQSSQGASSSVTASSNSQYDPYDQCLRASQGKNGGWIIENICSANLEAHWKDDASSVWNMAPVPAAGIRPVSAKPIEIHGCRSNDGYNRNTRRCVP